MGLYSASPPKHSFLSLIANNFLSVIYNGLVSVLIIALDGLAMNLSPTFPLPYKFAHGVLEITLQSIVLIITLLIFILLGRFLLLDTGSLWKNACSVMIPLILELACAYSVAHAHQIDLLGLYYGYCYPFVLPLSFGVFSLVPYENTLLYGVAFASLPFPLYVLGLQWQSRKKRP